MKIVKIETFVTIIPLKEKSVLAHSQHTAAISVNVKLHTDEGIIGLGTVRTPGAHLTGETRESIVAFIDNYIEPAIIGCDLMETEKLMEKINDIKVGNQFAKAAVDIAIYDAVGKRLGLPICQLFGGPYRNKVELVGWIGINEPEVMAEKALNFVKEGFKTIKLKIGTPDLRKDIERVKKVREAIGPSIALRVDINAAYNVPDAVKVLKGIAPLDLQVVEDPLEERDMEGWKRLARSTDVPLGADLGIRLPVDAFNIIAANIVDFIKIKIVKVGGFHNALKIISLAESAGVHVIVGRGTCSNIEALAELHLSAARKHVTLAGEMVGPMKLTDDIVDHPMEARDGAGLVPESPGLGVDLVEEKVAKYKQ